MAGEPIEIGFNPAYLLDALKVATDDTVCLDLVAPNQPGLIRSGNMHYVMMPIELG